MGSCRSRPRKELMIGLRGSWVAKLRIHDGIELIGTNRAAESHTTPKEREGGLEARLCHDGAGVLALVPGAGERLRPPSARAAKS